MLAIINQAPANVGYDECDIDALHDVVNRLTDYNSYGINEFDHLLSNIASNTNLLILTYTSDEINAIHSLIQRMTRYCDEESALKLLDVLDIHYVKPYPIINRDYSFRENSKSAQKEELRMKKISRFWNDLSFYYNIIFAKLSNLKSFIDDYDERSEFEQSLLQKQKVVKHYTFRTPAFHPGMDEERKAGTMKLLDSYLSRIPNFGYDYQMDMTENELLLIHEITANHLDGFQARSRSRALHNAKPIPFWSEAELYLRDLLASINLAKDEEGNTYDFDHVKEEEIIDSNLVLTNEIINDFNNVMLIVNSFEQSLGLDPEGINPQDRLFAIQTKLKELFTIEYQEDDGHILTNSECESIISKLNTFAIPTLIASLTSLEFKGNLKTTPRDLVIELKNLRNSFASLEAEVKKESSPENDLLLNMPKDLLTVVGLHQVDDNVYADIGYKFKKLPNGTEVMLPGEILSHYAGLNILAVAIYKQLISISGERPSMFKEWLNRCIIKELAYLISGHYFDLEPNCRVNQNLRLGSIPLDIQVNLNIGGKEMFPGWNKKLVAGVYPIVGPSGSGKTTLINLMISGLPRGTTYRVTKLGEREIQVDSKESINTLVEAVINELNASSETVIFLDSINILLDADTSAGKGALLTRAYEKLILDLLPFAQSKGKVLFPVWLLDDDTQLKTAIGLAEGRATGAFSCQRVGTDFGVTELAYQVIDRFHHERSETTYRYGG